LARACNQAFSWLGLSFRDDAVERRNIAALTALCGAVPAVALTYIGGSLGEGPSYWNNVFSASLGTVGLLGVWLLLELGAFQLRISPRSSLLVSHFDLAATFGS